MATSLSSIYFFFVLMKIIIYNSIGGNIMRYKKFYPNSYVKDIYDIDYRSLKRKGIKCLIFDLDNTIALIDQKLVSDKTVQLFSKLEKDFQLVIISNNTKDRVSEYARILHCDYVSFALKPLLHGFRKIKKKYHFQNSEMCMIGDQLVTDIFGGNRFSNFTILVDPIGKKDLKITSFNRLIEKNILKYYEKNKIMKKGEYYHGK